MNKFIVAVILTLALVPVANAQGLKDVFSGQCVTKQMTKDRIKTLSDDITVFKETSDSIEFTKPDRDTNLIVFYDDKGCAYDDKEVDKPKDLSL